MKKLLFSFIDSNEIDVYELLGFKIEVDDALNQIFSAELDLSDYDLLALLAVLEDCEREGIYPNLEINDNIYNFEEAIKIADELAAADPLKI
jgi:hypothetical protein